jgi:dTDP-4-dehydrorhamnose reductase
MKYSIIGSGLVGNALHKQLSNSVIYDRTTSYKLIQQELDVLIVAAPTGNRIRVNQDPAKDLIDCQQLVDLIRQCHYNQLIYISTVDVYANKTSANADPDLHQPSANYGNNRWFLEQAMSHMPNIHITRIASLVDLLMNKNILYDLKLNLTVRSKWCYSSDLQHKKS